MSFKNQSSEYYDPESEEIDYSSEESDEVEEIKEPVLDEYLKPLSIISRARVELARNERARLRVYRRLLIKKNN